jgi:tetratricopeptide (TPR) repeat protein
MKRFFLLITAVVMTAGIASAQDINEATTNYNSGATELQMGNNEAALTYFQTALQMGEALGEPAADLVANCKNAICSVTLSMAKDLYNAKDFAGAIEAFNKAKEVAEGYGNAEVAAEAEELVKNSQMNMYNTAGTAAKRSKDYAGAIENFTKVLEMDPTNGAAAFNLGDSYYRLKKFAEAETYLLQAKENGQEKAATPRLANISLMQAKASLKAKKYQEALDHANTSIGYDPTSAAYETAGDALQGLGKNAEAAANFELALPEAKPKAVNQLKYKIAAAAQAMGDKAKAIEYYNMILGDPNFAEFAKYQIAELSK